MVYEESIHLSEYGKLLAKVLPEQNPEYVKELKEKGEWDKYLQEKDDYYSDREEQIVFRITHKHKINEMPFMEREGEYIMAYSEAWEILSAEIMGRL